MSTCHTADAVAEMFTVDPSYIRRLAAAREIPHLRIGRRYVFTDDHVQAIRERFEQPVVPVRSLSRRRSA